MGTPQQYQTVPFGKCDLGHCLDLARNGTRFEFVTVVDDPERHIAAMRERERKDFHVEFTTLRFRALSEHGEWEGRRDLVPTSAPTR